MSALERCLARWRAQGVVAAIAFAIAAPAAGAGVEIALERIDAGTAEAAGRLLVDGPRLRLEPPATGDDAPGGVIFRADRVLLWLLDPTARSALQLERAELEARARELGAARRELEARLATLPADQRAVLERMLGTRAPSPPSAPLELRATDRVDHVDGRRCRVRELTRGDEVAGSLCVVDWDEAGVARRELSVFRELARFQRGLLETAGIAAGFAGVDRALAAQPFEVFDALDGFPLESRVRRPGGGEEVTRLRVVGRPVLEESDFVPPLGWAITRPESSPAAAPPAP